MRTNLFQLLAMLAIIAASVHLVSVNASREPIWRHKPLKYSNPIVPSQFLMIPNSASPNQRQDSNAFELYVQNHRAGWEKIRRMFYEKENWREDFDAFDFYDEYELSKLSFRGDIDRVHLAQYHGREACRHQLSSLLDSKSEHQIRSVIAFSPYWRFAPGILVLGFFTLVLLNELTRTFRPHKAQ